MLRRFITLLNSPFPDRKDMRAHVRETFFIALFIAFFLYAFNPFGFHHLEVGRLVASLCFGAVTFLCSVSFDLFVRYVVKLRTDLPTWTLWKWLITVLGAVLWIAIGNYAALMLLEPHPFRIEVFVSMLINTYLVAWMPILAMGMALQLRAEKHNQQEALALVGERGIGLNRNENAPRGEASDPLDQMSQTEIISFDVSANEQLSLNADDIVLIEAMQNYLTVYHRKDHGHRHDELSETIQKTVIRSTMANADALLKHTEVLRCHRSFMVNLSHIMDVSGNAQGLRLTMRDIQDQAVPVSRRYISTVKARLAQ